MKNLVLKFNNFLKENLWLLLILLFAFAIRLYGIYFDFPLVANYINDETYSMTQLFDILVNKSLSSSSHYPALLTVLYAPAVFIKSIYLMLAYHLRSMAELKDFILLNGLGHINILTRWFSVFFGVASVYLIYRIFYLIRNNKFTAYLAALTATVMINPVFLSHWGKAHGAVALFLLWSLYFALRFERDKGVKYLYFSSLLAACSMGAHYVGLSAFVFPLYAVATNYKIFGWIKTVKVGLIGFFSTAVFYALNFGGVLDMVKYVNTNYYSKTHFGGLLKTTLVQRFTYLFQDSFYLEPVLFILTAIFLLFYAKELWRNRLTRYFLIGVIFNYFIMTTLIVTPGLTRFSLIFMMLSFPLAIFLLVEFLFKKYNKILVVMMVLILLLPSLIYSAKWDVVVSKYTAVEAANWLMDNVRGNDSIYSFYNILYLPFSYEAAVWNNKNNNLSYKKIDYILNHPDRFKGKGYNLFYDHYQNRFKDLAGEGTDLVVVSYDNKKEKIELLSEIERYHSLTLLKEFSPVYNKDISLNEDVIDNPMKWLNIFNYKMAGPFIEIYKINL